MYRIKKEPKPSKGEETEISTLTLVKVKAVQALPDSVGMCVSAATAQHASGSICFHTAPMHGK